MPQLWTCLFCDRPTTLTGTDVSDGKEHLFSDSPYGPVGLKWQSARCPNPECREISLSVSFGEWKRPRTAGMASRVGNVIEAWRLRPQSSAKQLPDYVPRPIQEDYYEAYLIIEKSPKASATLSRRCLQGMIRDFWAIKGRTLFEEINALEERVDANTWKAIKAVKDVGNIGAHMEKNINHIVDVDPDEAQLLIEMIEQLIGDWYIQRFEREQRTQRITELAEAKQKQKHRTEALQESTIDSNKITR